jgi:phosphoserine phosphatase RsbU/P
LTQDHVATPGRGQTLLHAPVAPSSPEAVRLLRMGWLTDPALSELPIEELLTELLDRVRTVLSVDTVVVLLVDDAGRELVARAAIGLEEEVEQRARVPLGAGFAGRVAAGRTPIFIPEVTDADIVNPILRGAGVRSLLGVPMVVEGDVTGVMHVGTRSPRTFTDDDAALLQLAAGQAAPAVARARLHQALDREHRDAAALQRSLLPGGVPDVDGFEIAARYLPARSEIGGDWYDVVALPDGRIGVAIGDVAGHGVAAAALMGQLRIGLRAYALFGAEPAETLPRLDLLLRSLGEGMATALYAVLDPRTGVAKVASAGHLPPVVVGAGGEARLMDIAVAPPLGTFVCSRYAQATTTLEPGAMLVLYTDGLIERRREALDVGFERLRETMRSESAEEACARIIDTLVPPLGASDDVAVVVLRRTG